MKRIFAIAACAVAAAVFGAVVLSACGSSGPAPVSAHGAGAIVLVGGGASAGIGVDNTDLLAATPSGRVLNLTSSPAAESNASWSADGSHVVFVRHSTTGRENGAVALQVGIYVWSPGHGAPQRIASCSKYCYGAEFTWSPDDRQIAFVSPDDGGIEVMNADGSDAHLVCDAKRSACGGGLMWSPDGRKLVFSFQNSMPMGPVERLGAIWIANVDGSGVEKLTQPNCNSGTTAGSIPPGCAFDTSPVWSPDGRLIAFSRYSPGDHGSAPTGPCGPAGPIRRIQAGKRCEPARPGITTSLEVMRADGSHLRSIYDCRTGNWCNQELASAWAPDGKAIAYAPQVDRTLSSFRITTLAGKTTTIHTCDRSGCLAPESLTWSPNGKQLTFLAGGTPPQRDVWVIGRDGTEMHRVAVGVDWCCLAWVGHVSLSGAKAVPNVPTATHLHLSGTIAYDHLSPDLVYSVNLLSLGTGRTHVLRMGAIQGLDPSWSPDGREIAFGGYDPNTNINVAGRNGKNVRVLTRFHRGATQPVWSPDGRTIAFEADGGIGLVPAAGGRPRTLVPNGTYPSWSPSGNRLVFERHLGPRSEALFTIRRDGTGLQRLTNLPEFQRSPVWSPDGQEIAFEWSTPSGSALYLIRPDGTHLRRVTSAALIAGRPAWSPDSRYLVVISARGLVTSTQLRVIDVKSGGISTLATVPGYAANPSWSSR